MRTLILTAIPVLLLSGCDAAVSAAGLGWSKDVFTVEIGGVYEHDLADGQIIELDWAADSAVACFPATENTNFDGNHVFFGLSQPPGVYMTVAAMPEPGLDISLYNIQMPKDVFDTPPELTDVMGCDEAYDFEFDSNPGELEYVETLSYASEVNILIGVAGVDGAAEGRFELEIFAEEAN